MTDIKSRIKGCLYLGAIGDALGSYFENSTPPISFHSDFPWKISDDTQFTLATCEAIVEQEAVSPSALANKFLLWYERGWISGIGSSTLTAMKGLQAGGHWALAGRQGEFAAGNGAAMRIAPLAFLNPSRQTIADVCRITHRNDEAYIGALAIVASIRATIEGNWQNGTQLIPAIAPLLPDSNVKERLLNFNREKRSISVIAKQYGNSGYVADSVPLAIYAAQQFNTMPLSEIFTEIIESGGDTDTICSMAGNIIGSFSGYEQIPSDYLNKLNEVREAVLFKEIVNRFVESVARLNQ